MDEAHLFSEELFYEWVKAEKEKSKTKRGYIHFDRKINITKNVFSLKNFLSNQLNIVQHSFYPLIQTTLQTPRYKKTGAIDKNGKPIRKLEIKPRKISYASHFDSVIYSWYSTILTTKYEALIKKLGIYDNVLAYLKKGESNIHFAHKAFEFIRSQNECVALAFDITNFFDSLDHIQLKNKWLNVLSENQLPADHFAVYKSITNYSFVTRTDLEIVFADFFSLLEKNKKIKNPKDKFRPERICTPRDFREYVRKKGLIQSNLNINQIASSEKKESMCGIPQGTPISACLSNIYMIDFDVNIQNAVDKVNGKYYRYSDDILLIVPKNYRDFIVSLVANQATKSHLELNTSKTEITYFYINSNNKLRAVNETNKSNKLQYLGFEFDGENVYIRSSSFSKYNARLSARIKKIVKATYGKHSLGDIPFKRNLLQRYTDLGKRNFVTYAIRAGRIMDSKTIRKQYRNSSTKVQKKLQTRKETFLLRKSRR